MRLPLPALAASALLLTASAAALHAEELTRAGAIEVMDQNLYVGVEVFRILQAGDPSEIPGIVAEMLQIVAATDFAARAEVIADAIEERQPHLVGLQEVALYRTQSPGDFLLGNPQPAETVWIDFLQLLLDALEARGLHYAVAAEMVDADVEMPYLAGFVGGVPQLDDARLTDRNVILARAGVATENATEIHFVWNLHWNVGGVPIDFDRGYQAVDATVEGRTYRFANTHLEPLEEAAAIRALQGVELAQRLSVSPYPVIAVGDYNARRGDPAPIPGVPAPWEAMAAWGFEDAWLHRVGEPISGLTCCRSEMLDDPDSPLYERVDYVFVRGAGGLGRFDVLGPVHLELLGDQPWEVTPSGLWPADHAGLQAHLVLAVPVQ